MFDDVLGSASFYILCGVGYAAFVIMLMILKGMEQSSIMPWWVKIATMIVIPFAAALFTGVAEG